MCERLYKDPLPFVCKEEETREKDRNWLQEIVETTPPFSDRWTKARIVELAYELNSEEKIVDCLQSQCNVEQYPCFKKAVDEEYVINALNEWKGKKFRQSIGRNFEVFVCKQNPHAFLVVSRTTAAFDVKPNLPPSERFRPLFNVDELAVLIEENNIKRLTLRTHGYGTPSARFYEDFYQEVNNLKDVAAKEQFYIGYNWPSETPLDISGTRFDWLKGVSKNPDIYFKFALVLVATSVIIGSFSNLFIEIIKGLFGWQFFNFQPQWIGLVSFVFVFWSLAFYLLREVAYQGDRTRAIYYGIPDLVEFFSRLDRGISKLNKADPGVVTADNSKKISDSKPLKINIIGHSMGGFVVLNAISILRYQFRYEEEKPNQFGEHFQLDKLILASPDVPLELMRQGRNNYLRSAFNCSDQIYLLSSDRDIVLRYLSTVGNWFSEPDIPMSGLRLGNVYLREYSQVKIAPWVRGMFYSQPTLQPTSDPELFNKLNYLDCSQMGSKKGRGGVNGIRAALANISLEKSQIDINLNGMFIDLGNAIRYVYDSTLYRLKQSGLDGLDLHGGYFQQETLSFEILEFLLKTELEETEIQKQLEIMTDDRSEIRFLPSSKQSNSQQTN